MSPGLLRTVIALFFLSGAIGLVYEVVWAKLLGAVLGHTGLAHAVVLATFMGGLAIGNAWLGRLADRAKSQLTLYGWLEIGVGLFAALSPVLLAGLSAGYVQVVKATGLTGNGLLAAKIAVAALALLPPTILMGGTLPALGRFTTRSMATMQSSIARLYFLNSFGAVAGSLVAGFLWIPSLGLDRTLMLGAVLNVAVGMAAIVIGKRIAEVQPELAPEPEARLAEDAGRVYGAGPVRLMLVAVAFSGFVSLAFEVAWIRLLSLVLGSSTFSFSLMLAAFVGGIATGSWLVHKGLAPGKDPFAQFGWAQAGIALSVLLTLPFYERLPLWVMQLGAMVPRAEGTFLLFEGFKFAVCFLLMLAPATCIGMTLPLATRVVTRAVGEVGTRVGMVFSLNTFGNLTGALLAALVMLPALGLRGTILTGVAINLTLAGAVALAVAGRTVKGFATAAVPLAAFAVYVAAVPGWDMRMLATGTYRHTAAAVLLKSEDPWKEAGDFEHLFHHDDASASIDVTRRGENVTLSTNGKADASSRNDMGTQKLLGHLPLVLHPDAKDVMIVGLGSGATAGAVLTHPVQAVDVVEISPGVVEANRFFKDVSRDALADPRTRLHLEDAGGFLRLSNRQYDVLISEPSNPWVAGIGNLFSADFYEEATRHLKPGGLMVQWFHLYEMDNETLKLVLRTFTQRFPHVALWQVQQADVVLIGSHQPIDPGAAGMAARMRSPEVAKDLASIGVRRLPTLLAMQMASDATVRRMAGDGPVNTELRPILEYQAPRAFFMNASAILPFEADDRRVGPSRGTSQLLLPRAQASGALRLNTGDWQEISESRARWFTTEANRPVSRVFLEAWRRAEPDAERPQGELVDWLRAQGHLEAAQAALQPLLAKHPDHPAYLDVAVDLAFELLPTRVGFLGVDEAAYKQTKAQVEKLRRLAPATEDELDRRMAAIAFAAGFSQDGYACIDRSAERTQGGERLALWMVAAQAAMDVRDHRTAANYLRRALAQDPTYGPALAIGQELAKRRSHRQAP
jgi:predicted membrane-bound spermidine synthase/tetratricopeptide (TPR) repeat protein